jgi:hypothetical protein
LRRRSLLRTSLFSKPGNLIGRPDLAVGLFWLKACEVAGMAVGGARALRDQRPVPVSGPVSGIVPRKLTSRANPR